MELTIIQDLVAPGQRNRPHTNPASSLYKKVMIPLYIVFHNAYSSARARALAVYCKSDRAAARPASWQENVDHEDIIESIPTNEQAWHAGCNLCDGNVRSIGYEICDFAMLQKNQDLDLFLKGVDHACKLAAWHLYTIPSLSNLPFKEMMTQHWDWSGKNCPSWIRAMIDGWPKILDTTWDYYNEYKKVEVIEEVIEAELPDLPDDALVTGVDPDIDRDWIDKHEKEFEQDNDPYEDKKRKISAGLYGDPHAKIQPYKKKIFVPNTKIEPRNDWVKRSRGLWRGDK